MILSAGRTRSERLVDLELEVSSLEQKLRNSSKHMLKLERQVQNYERGKSWVAVPPLEPVCSVCGMSSVELVLQPVDHNSSTKPSTLTYFCGWGCLQLATNRVLSLTPRHSLAGRKRKT